ncbi:uncharacterized protein LOC119360421 [Triticum dicoccoides]|uniref:uncharacterized protein LOC119360421 n=1 Tax=Triticum dicoccoides TaxID=85692 RepID=UPI00188FED75|nr:uncharacterized protein LOC119360421 [Triticum dicoccoides]XP_044321309.1 uncharacterized protein LOC123043037 [Triticum aestivum]
MGQSGQAHVPGGRATIHHRPSLPSFSALFLASSTANDGGAGEGTNGEQDEDACVVFQAGLASAVLEQELELEASRRVMSAMVTMSSLSRSPKPSPCLEPRERMWRGSVPNGGARQ